MCEGASCSARERNHNPEYAVLDQRNDIGSPAADFLTIRFELLDFHLVKVLSILLRCRTMTGSIKDLPGMSMQDSHESTVPHLSDFGLRGSRQKTHGGRGGLR
eukprot:3906380-Pyramimonas_sp.AAC.1